MDIRKCYYKSQRQDCRSNIELYIQPHVKLDQHESSNLSYPEEGINEARRG